jgi:hypothetical protein
MQNGVAGGELASLLAQLSERKSQIERLLVRVDEVLRGSDAAAKSKRAAEVAPREVLPARQTPLDKVKAVMEATADLREANGRLSAARVAKVFGVSLSQLAGWLGRTKQAVSKTPDADSLQDALGYFERVARLRMITKDDAEFRKWLRTPHELLDSDPPLRLMTNGECQALVDYVEDILTGTPG